MANLFNDCLIILMIETDFLRLHIVLMFCFYNKQTTQKYRKEKGNTYKFLDSVSFL